MNRFLSVFVVLFLLMFNVVAQKQMMFGDTTRTSRPYSKDPHVVEFKGKYIMYYSIPPSEKSGNTNKRWGIGIAESKNLKDWKRIGEIVPQADYESNGLCAPGALLRNDTIHLFYQTYGNGPKDAICHAWSVDGVNFIRNSTNPIYSPKGSWNCGRAIDAEVIFFNNKYFLYYATRTPDYETQIIGVATAPVNTNFSKQDWSNPVDKAVLVPQYPWEGKCVEGASVVQRGDSLFMFYAGSYNNQPQQVGLAKSKDGIKWEKLSNKPFLANGDPGAWNYSESGHPHIFVNSRNKSFLFYQGNNDHGRTWFLTNNKIKWNKKGLPVIK